jgi:O-antigen ligase
MSFLRFLLRYPIFLLAFGPPLFRPNTGIDATKGVIDFWAFLQVGVLSVIAIRAILRLVAAESILIPRQIRSILRLAFFLGLLFLASAVYSPSHIVSAAYAIFYLLTIICVAEFVVDVYWNPPNWIECLFHLRHISLLLLAVVLLTLAIKPVLVLVVIEGAGIRLLGAAVAPVPVICPIIATISAYSFLYYLESRVRSILFFLVGLTGTLVTQARGSEIAVFLCLLIMVIGWAKTSRRFAYLFISGFMVTIVFISIVAGTIGGRIWNTFNRGQDAAGISSASGRTELWAFVIKYCMTHPWGMGYVAGFRIVFRQYFSLNSGQTLSNIGTAHNTFIDVLAGAGWLALAIYLIIIVKIFRLGWRFVKKKTHLNPAFDSVSRHGIQCSLVLLIFCLAFGMYATDFSAPLRAAFYYLYIIIAVILGASARMLATSRPRHIS